MQAFIAELRRRNVLRAAAFYAAAGWLLVQVATQVMPFFDIPIWVVRVVVLAISLGFPAALVFSWFYELTPEGLKLESEVLPSESVTRQTARRLDRWIIAVLGLAVVFLLADKLVLHQASAPALTTAALPAAAGNDKSVAVLPFANLSRDPDNAFFADGMQDEILTKLSRIGALRVVSRTSTQRYASAPDSVAQIARQLGVANILEGSVQKAGNAVHINVQLVSAGDSHLWAESYDRKLDDIFGVEGEVAQAVADALNARLTGAEQQALAAKPTTNPAAYEAYLRGLAIASTAYSFGSAKRSVDAYYEVVRLDPNFALAWAQIALNASILYFDGLDQQRATAGAVREAAETALKLQPQSGEALLAHGYYLYRVEHDYAGALEDFRLAQEKLPKEPAIAQGMFLVKRRLGRWDDALSHQKELILRSPHDVSVLSPSGCEGFNYVRRFDEARAVLNQALLVTPDEPNTLGCLAKIEQDLGNLDAADALLARAAVGVQELAGPERVLQLLYRRNYREAIRIIEASLPPDDASLIGPDLQNLVYLGYARKWAGDAEGSRTAFERAIKGLLRSPDVMEHTEILGHQTLALAYAGLGQKAEAGEAARKGVELNANDAIKLPMAGIAQAQVYAQAGDRDAAIALLPHLLEVPAGLNPPLLRFDPMWDPIRDDPRFLKLAGAETPRAAATP